jgi:NADH pyrophosphatase NudC (nudix superfamily)
VQALAGQVPDPCKVELEDARWFTRAQVPLPLFSSRSGTEQYTVRVHYTRIC